MPDLDVGRLLKVLALVGGASTDGEKLAALARAEAMLKTAGKTWTDVIGTPRTAPPSADARLQAVLNAERAKLAQERAAFAQEKALWHQKQMEWRRQMSDEQRERMAREHDAEIAGHRAERQEYDQAARKRTQDVYEDWDQSEPDAPDEPPRSAKWQQFAVANKERAHWIVMNMDRKDFAASLYEWVNRTGMLTAKQAAAVDNNIDGG